MHQVSVIIPNYNHAPYLKQRIDSVLAQTFDSMEVIILDDCSTDSSREIIQSYKGHPKVTKVILNETNSGSTFRQWNKGISLAQSEIIWIAESDDFAEPDFLQTLMPLILADEKTGIAYSQSYRFTDDKIVGTWKSQTDDLDARKFEQDFRQKGTEYITNYLLHKNTIPNASGAVFRKKYYEITGGAEDAIKNCSDWLTWLKIALISDVSFVSRPLNYFRFHDNSVIATAVRTFDRRNYPEKYDRQMRLRFREILRKEHPEEQAIAKVNDQYIYREYGDEALFNIYGNRIGNGWKKLVPAVLNSNERLYYLKSAIKQSLKQVFHIN